MQVEQPTAALQTPQMKQYAVLPFIMSQLNQTALLPEEEHQIQQINSAKLLIEQYYNEKVADMDTTGRRATKYELEALEDRKQSTLGLEVNKKGAIERVGEADPEFEAEICKLAVDGQKAAATAITSLATGDFESATQWMLTLHHYDRIIAGKAQQRREQALAPDNFECSLGPNVGVSEVLGQKSKDKLKQQAKTAKLIELPKESQITTPNSIQQPQSSIQQIPTSRQTHGRGGRFKRNRQGIVSLYLNHYNNQLQQPNNERGNNASNDDRFQQCAGFKETNDEIEGIEQDRRQINDHKRSTPELMSPIAPLPLQQMKQPCQFKGNLILEQQYQSKLNDELKNVIIKETNSIQVYNPTFIVPRKDGKLRKILDCRRFNFITKHVHFKKDGAEPLIQILQQSDYAKLQDFNDALHHAHVQPNIQLFFGFKFQNKSYTDLGHSFAWILSPFFFSKTLAIAIRAIRTKLIITNCINRGNNDTKQKKKVEDKIKSLDPNDKLNINCDNQKFIISDWRYQLPSISIHPNITLEELSEQPKNQSSSQRWMASISEVEQTNFVKFVINAYLVQTNQTKTTERSNPEHKPDDRCQRRQLRHDIG
ncbi:MAG: hypothetical protein EZS28_000207 [Streblomastix strix]|uniref:Reverse transcriptase domain-containing protein n=1 Tax=Streblomastix strix TaxID=222440 RepID=A0A5J4XBS4_9EUKA|nr:MAG: hypothetical protein EZS28_000199 [Streblomastix strix]KAA6404274.1 MAG: hypothetical protein EZS28_000207 [Streblomastix strix]